MENQQYFEILKNTFDMKINILFDKHVLELIAPQLWYASSTSGKRYGDRE
jgi:hypothetical protein